MTVPAMTKVVTLDQALAEVQRELTIMAENAGSYTEDPANWHRHTGSSSPRWRSALR